MIWKLSNVVPIPKGDLKKNDVQSYRPISLLPIISKSLEKHFHQLISEFVSENKLLSDDQFGFRPGQCTTTPLVLSIHEWHKALENKMKVACVFFNIRKAFDSVPHNALLNKIFILKFPQVILQWLFSYLTSCSSSSWLPVKSGVPQGLILCPLLFLLYMNDISNIPLSSGSKLFLF